MALIIVESPTKARTFNKILNPKDYFVFASMGHIRDLPGNKMAIDFKHQFKPSYIVVKKKQDIVVQLKDLASRHKEIILATDPDREGESIGYHVAYILGYIDEKWPDFKMKGETSLKRIVFHEITSAALNAALKNPQGLRVNLVKAQQARRLLDRVVGYELSPLLWKKMGKNWLSAGRVQTVALRLIVEREKEITEFKVEDYFQIDGLFINTEKIKARLTKKNDTPYEQKFTLNLFAGNYQYTKTTIDAANLESLNHDLKSDTYSVSQVKETLQNRFPPPPYSTSTLQQDGFQRFGFSAKMTMRLAQDLYEQGLITYHRTDSFNLSPQFTTSARKFILDKFGSNYALPSPRFYQTKSKLAQEAHEAIRPTDLSVQIDNSIEASAKMTQNHKKLYKLVFNRALATQMKQASIKSIKLHILGTKGYLFESEMQKVMFDGFLKVLNPDYAAQNQKSTAVKTGDKVKLESLDAIASATKPPPRYNEASLIRTLEEKGIGRPSTYSPIISLIQDKNYVDKENKLLIPSQLGTSISNYLSQSFPDVFDLNFTALLEERLDKIAQGQEDTVKLLSEFNAPFQQKLKIQKDDRKYIDVEQDLKEICPQCASKLVVRFSKYGKFIACSGYPKCKFTKPFLQYVSNKLCPKDAGKIVVRFTKSRRNFFGCVNYPKCDFRSWKLDF